MNLKKRLDASLNAVTMYRLVMWLLVGLFAIVFLLSVAGNLIENQSWTLHFSPLYLMISAAILVGVSMLTNAVAGKIIGHRPHQDSAIITGLILFFIFSPLAKFSLGDMASLAAIATLATASKYLLVWRRRHIFNPVAIAAVLAMVLSACNVGIATASWWVATPVLLIPTSIISLLILYKTRRLNMGILFVAVAAIAIAVRFVLQGQVLDLALLSTIFASWPLIFFAGVMLSEPLTLPPRKGQQLLEAAGVGLLVALPFIDFGGITSTPELALVFGNIFALIVARRRGIQLYFVGAKKIAHEVVELEFRSPRKVSFLAGQYMELHVPHSGVDSRGVRRVFTVVSRPHQQTVKFALKLPEGASSYKKALLNLKKDDTIWATHIAGDFTLPDSHSQKILYVAGGVGFTPFISHIEHILHNTQKRNITFIYAVNKSEECAYLPLLEKFVAQKQCKLIVVSGEGEVKIPGAVYVNSAYITKDILKEYVKDIDKRDVYISGPPPMVDAVKKSAVQLGAPKVVTDYFTGY